MSKPGRLPCPFCGGVPTTLERTLRDGHAAEDEEAYAYAIRCVSCAAAGGWAKTEGNARRLWNMRAGRPPEQETVRD